MTRFRISAVSAVAALATLIVLVCVQLSSSSDRVAGSSGVSSQVFVAEIGASGGILCQSQEPIAHDAATLRATLGTYSRPGPTLTVIARLGSGSAIVGGLASGWREGEVRIPISGSKLPKRGFELCVRSRGGARLAFGGEPSAMPASVDGKPQPGRASLLAVGDRERSFASMLPELRQRIGRGNASFVGPWSVYLIGALLLTAFSLSGFAVLRAPLPPRVEATNDERPGSSWRYRLGKQPARIPSTGYALAGASLAVALAWALLTPPFQVPDETSHVSYVQYFAETGKLPAEDPRTTPFSQQENATLGALGFARIIGRPNERALTSPQEERALRAVEHEQSVETTSRNAANASSNPPLYYVLAAGVYRVTGGTLLERILAIRFLSALFTAFAVLLTFMFVRELLPRSPWAWTAAGVACAFQPVLGFIGSGVNPDCLLFACSSGVLFACMRTLRRGLSPRLAVALALFAVGGLLTKPLFLALIPAIGLTLLLTVARDRRDSLRGVGIASGLIVVSMLAYMVFIAAPLHHPYFANAQNVASTASGSGAVSTSIGREASFVVQQFFPRPPFLTDFVPGFPLRDVWVAGLVGVFGWVDYRFPATYQDLGMLVLISLLALTVVALARQRAGIVRAVPGVAVCLLALAGVLAVVGVTDYQAAITNGARFQQARYLLPLLALYGGLFALGSKAIGERATRLALPWLLAGVAFHTFAALVLTANRYYL